MDKEKNTRLPLVDLIEVKPMQDGYRWVAITAMLFAIGIILHTVSPNVGGVTPNWTIAMYSIVINLTNPTLSQAVGIGFIAGITLVPSSKSAFPLGNIASELSGAITCCILVKAMLRCGLGKWKLRPLVTGFLAPSAAVSLPLEEPQPLSSMPKAHAAAVTHSKLSSCFPSILTRSNIPFCERFSRHQHTTSTYR